MDVAVELERVRDLVRPVLEDVGGAFEITAPKGTVLRTEMRPEAFAAIIRALVRNSVDWMAPKRDLRVDAVVRAHADEIVVVFSDNGKGAIPAGRVAVRTDGLRSRRRRRDGPLRSRGTSPRRTGVGSACSRTVGDAARRSRLLCPVSARGRHEGA